MENTNGTRKTRNRKQNEVKTMLENSTSTGYTIDAEVVRMPIKYGNKVMIQNTQNTLMKYR